MPASSQSRAPENQTSIGSANQNEQAEQNRHREAIEKLAYALWENRGRPDGSADTDWIEAEQQLLPRSAAMTAKG